MSVKKRDFERILMKNGYQLSCNNGAHEKWTRKEGGKSISLPRHKEINKILARRLLKEIESEG